MKSQSSTWVAALLLVGLAGAAGYRLAGKQGTAAVPRNGGERVAALGSIATGAPSDDTDALRGQVAQLRLQVARLAAQVNGPKPDGSTQGQATPAPVEPSLPPAEQIEHDRVAWDEHMIAVSADFEAEPRDSRWAQATTTMLKDRVTADRAIQDAVKQIECRSTICRVEMLDDQKGQFGRRLPVFLQSLGSVFPTAQASTATNPDGTKTLSVYFSTTTGADAPGSRGS